MADDSDLTQASPTGADPDAWDAKPADEENAPRDDDASVPHAEDRDHEERIPGTPHERTGDRTEGGAGRP